MPAVQTTGDRVYQTLRDLILTGELPAGERLVQRTLAKRFGTSNIPVVEAIRRLEHDGLVEGEANLSSTVRRFSFEDIEGLYLAREALEGVTCRLFAERARPPERERLKEIEAEFDAHAEAGREKACCEADIAFHMHIAHGSGSPLLARTLETSCVFTTTIGHTDWLPSVPYVGPAGIHRELVAALLAGDPDAAERAGKAHVHGPLVKIRRYWLGKDVD
jgi:DNA-binding GntR family transcriptional regulator